MKPIARTPVIGETLTCRLGVWGLLEVCTVVAVRPAVCQVKLLSSGEVVRVHVGQLFV